jgi:hypothetical protein
MWVHQVDVLAWEGNNYKQHSEQQAETATLDRMTTSSRRLICEILTPWVDCCKQAWVLKKGCAESEVGGCEHRSEEESLGG